MNPAAGEQWFKMDFSPMELVPSEPDVDSATTPSVVLYKRHANKRYDLVAISLGDHVFDPTHPAWRTAKYFALQGAGVLTTLLMHPKLHFPSNCVDAITRTRLPAQHWLRKLLLPHFRLAMSVNYAVLYGDLTVLRPGRIYAPYPGTLKEHSKVVATLWQGYPSGPSATPTQAYPRYALSLEPPVVHSNYGEFLGRYWHVLFDFAKRVVDEMIPPGSEPDHAVVEWANHCAGWLPGFPDASQITTNDNLARAFASTVLDISVAHSADHYLYGQVNLREVPFRLKTQVPTTSSTHSAAPSKLTTWRDNFHYRMCMEMFFKPYVVEGIADVDYGFREGPLQAAARDFRAALFATDRALENEGLRYVPLAQIASSVQS